MIGASTDPEIRMEEELRNFEELALRIRPEPDDVPRLAGLDIAYTSQPLSGRVGGDHVVFLDFNRRYDLDARIRDARERGLERVAENLELNKRRAGILVADVAGHRATDAMVAAMLHQAFLLGTYYELDTFGEITTKLFEHLKTRFHETSSVHKFFTMVYGEISDRGTFRFLSAGHPRPVVFSRRFARIMRISADRLVTFTPVGMFPSSTGVDEQRRTPDYGYEERYTVNEINLLGDGDLLILGTDGLLDHGSGRFVAERLESCLVEAADLPAAGIVEAILAASRRFAPQDDDLTFVVIKKA